MPNEKSQVFIQTWLTTIFMFLTGYEIGLCHISFKFTYSIQIFCQSPFNGNIDMENK